MGKVHIGPKDSTEPTTVIITAMEVEESGLERVSIQIPFEAVREVEKIVEVPVEVIKEVEVIREIEVEKIVIQEKEVEKIVIQEKIIEVPVETIVIQEKEVKVHDIEPLLIEKDKVRMLKRSNRILRCALIVYLVISLTVMGAMLG